MIIGIIGIGFVGKATYQLACENVDIIAYDLDPYLCKPIGTILEDLLVCEIIFISVPTPMQKDGKCHLGIVRNVINDLRKIDFKNIIVLRSTVPVGTCDTLGVYFMPEFLTEKNYVEDFINNKDWIFGLLGSSVDDKFQICIKKLFNFAYTRGKITYNNLRFVTNSEAECVKMFRNCFLATKISFCNEMYEFCQIKCVNYDNVRKLAAKDERIMLSHTQVPGHDGKKGFGGTCFPKDTSSLCYEMKKTGMTPIILNSIIERNEKIDRPEKDWNDNKGRAVI